jgi:hypothetical protein
MMWSPRLGLILKEKERGTTSVSGSRAEHHRCHVTETSTNNPGQTLIITTVEFRNSTLTPKKYWITWIPDKIEIVLGSRYFLTGYFMLKL